MAGGTSAPGVQGEGWAVSSDPERDDEGHQRAPDAEEEPPPCADRHGRRTLSGQGRLARREEARAECGPRCAANLLEGRDDRRPVGGELLRQCLRAQHLGGGHRQGDAHQEEAGGDDDPYRRGSGPEGREQDGHHEPEDPPPLWC